MTVNWIIAHRRGKLLVTQLTFPCDARWCACWTLELKSKQGEAVSVGKSIRRFLYLFLLCGFLSALSAQDHADPAKLEQSDAQSASETPSFIRAFSSADDLRKSLHPILDRSLDIIAGPKDPEPRVEGLQSPAAVATDSSGRVFVADRGAKAVQIFDFVRGKYGLLERGNAHASIPIALAVDGQDNLYVTDEVSRTILVYDSTGKFRRALGKLSEEESYFESPAGIAIDNATGKIYVCDMHRHMVVVLDNRGRLVAKVGKRGGGDGPGDFKLPTQAVIHDGELFILDAGNTRIQIFDTALHFRRAINLPYADGRTGLAVDDQGNIYVSNPVVDRIEVLTRAGRPLYRFDLASLKAAYLGQPAGLWISQRSCLYVIDEQKHVVNLFQLSGQNARHCP
jgi:DNA-binding beta-propeller fold protein YncE